MPLELILKEGREKSLLRRHPWVFSGAVAEINGEPVKGADVVIGDSKHHFLALASLSPESRLTARVWTFQEDEAVDQAFFDRRFQKAFKLRKAAFGALPDAFRLINAESDGLPGVIVDIYGDYAVCQLSSAGADFLSSFCTMTTGMGQENPLASIMWLPPWGDSSGPRPA